MWLTENIVTFNLDQISNQQTEQNILHKILLRSKLSFSRDTAIAFKNPTKNTLFDNVVGNRVKHGENRVWICVQIDQFYRYLRL